jgi:hypothetical protein
MPWSGVCERLLRSISTPYYLTMLPLRGSRILCNIEQVPNRHMTKVTKMKQLSEALSLELLTSFRARKA